MVLWDIVQLVCIAGYCPHFSFKFILFADDTNVFYSDHDINNLCATMSNELDKLHAWFTVNKLSLNISKTNYISKTNDILFGRRRCIADNVSITMGKSPISRVKSLNS